VTVTETVRSALEVDKVESHLHPQGSFDVADHVVPTGREEIWRFTPLKRLRDLHGDAPLTAQSCKASWTDHEGVDIRVVTGDEAQSVRGVTAWAPNARFAARVLAEVPASILVDVPAEHEMAEPIFMEVEGIDLDATMGAHMTLRFGAHSRGVIVVNHTGSAAVAAVVEVVVGDGADVTVVSLQDWEGDAVHLAHHQALVGRDATYKHVAVTFGGDVVRMDCNVQYSGPGGSAELLGLYFADAGQHIEHRLFADHTAPRTKSNVLYKGALQGQGAHTVWIGNVLIRKVAEGIETFEENRNLVLSDGCHADSVPNLEIETGEVAGAGHASATGRFDDEQLFYLMARGIPEAEARKLVVRGFFAELLGKIPVPALRDRLGDVIEARLLKGGA
jgi:Fe-S cluster assembly protein SufD